MIRDGTFLKNDVETAELENKKAACATSGSKCQFYVCQVPRNLQTKKATQTTKNNRYNDLGGLFPPKARNVTTVTGPRCYLLAP